MPLPFPAMSFSPFDILTAEEMNMMASNDQSLAAGTGLNAGAVTPDKRSGGFRVGNFIPSAGTGNKSVTGIGFQPKGVIFFGLRQNTSNEGIFSGGAYDGSNQFVSVGAARTTATSGNYTISNVNACVRITTFTSGSETILMQAVGVSLDADGFTLNFTNNNSSSVQGIGYIAFG